MENCFRNVQNIIKKNQTSTHASIKVIPTPVDELLEPCLVLALAVAGLPNEGRVGAEHDALVDVAVDGGVDLGVLHLREEVHGDLGEADVLCSVEGK